MKDKIKTIWTDWNEKPTGKKAHDVKMILHAIIFASILFYAISADYLDFVDEVTQKHFSFTDEEKQKFTDQDRYEIIFILIAIAGGAFLLPLFLIHYFASYTSFGIVFAYLKIRSVMN